MSDHHKTKAQLITELEILRQQAGKEKHPAAAKLATQAGFQRLAHTLSSKVSETTDHAEYKRLEALLQEREARLKEAYEALDIARSQALEAGKLKSFLLARVSHELRTPISGVLGYAELLMHEAFGDLNPEQKDATAQIVASANYLSNMVEDLLDEAQMTSKSLVLANEKFSPTEILEKVTATLQVLAANKGLQLVTSIAPEMPITLTGDLKRVQQIIINLASDAIKFTTKGEVCISLALPKPTQWSIQIADTGAGIPADQQEDIFKLFKQGNASMTRETRGAGLGLSISKQLVELMGGRITFQSATGQGNCFTITLPIQKNHGEEK